MYMDHHMPTNTNRRILTMASPLNLGLLDVNAYIEKNAILPVTSIFIRQPSSSEFDNNGLFSEEIFGQVGSPDRLIKFGYIDLKCNVLHPLVYNNIMKLSRWYVEILASKTYAIFDEKTKTFIKSTKEDGGSTGFLFFINNLHKLNFGKSESLTQQDKIDVISRNPHKLLINKMLVIPAGWRDVTVEDTRIDKDSINKLYSSLINYARALPDGGTTDDVYNGIMFAIQKKVCEIFVFLFDIAEGKQGFFQKKYGSRNLALGTRNVISTSNLSAKNPTSNNYLKVDEVGAPLFQTAKMFMPLVVYGLKMYFFNESFSMSSDNIAVINPKTLTLEYVPISEEEKNKFLSSEGIEKMVNLFRDKTTRHFPVKVTSEDTEKDYYLYMVYDTGKYIYKTRSIEELKTLLQTNKIPFNPKLLRPLTYSELIYIATYMVTKNRFSYVTRYPAIGIDSLVPSKIHLLSTSPDRAVKFVVSGQADAKLEYYDLPNYPVYNASYVDSASLHPSVLQGLGADFDGDTVSISGILSTEATEECKKHLADKSRYINSSGNIVCAKTDIVNLTLFNLSRNP